MKLAQMSPTTTTDTWGTTTTLCRLCFVLLLLFPSVTIASAQDSGEQQPPQLKVKIETPMASLEELEARIFNNEALFLAMKGDDDNREGGSLEEETIETINPEPEKNAESVSGSTEATDEPVEEDPEPEKNAESVSGSSEAADEPVEEDPVEDPAESSDDESSNETQSSTSIDDSTPDAAGTSEDENSNPVQNLDESTEEDIASDDNLDTVEGAETEETNENPLVLDQAESTMTDDSAKEEIEGEKTILDESPITDDNANEEIMEEKTSLDESPITDDNAKEEIMEEKTSLDESPRTDDVANEEITEEKTILDETAMTVEEDEESQTDVSAETAEDPMEQKVEDAEGIQITVDETVELMEDPMPATSDKVEEDSQSTDSVTDTGDAEKATTSNDYLESVTEKEDASMPKPMCGIWGSYRTSQPRADMETLFLYFQDLVGINGESAQNEIHQLLKQLEANLDEPVPSESMEEKAGALKKAPELGPIGEQILQEAQGNSDGGGSSSSGDGGEDSNNQTRRSANSEFVEGLDDIGKFFEDVDPPDELDIGADGTSIQEVLMGRGSQILRKRLFMGLNKARHATVDFSKRAWHILRTRVQEWRPEGLFGGDDDEPEFKYEPVLSSLNKQQEQR